MTYVGRFATTQTKLRAYLARKIRERGWEGQREPDLVALADRLASRGFIDDAVYAESKARSLTARGYGQRRVVEALRGAGVEETDGEVARQYSEEEAVTTALRFAERRRIGPFTSVEADRPAREKAIAAMVRAGHSFELARAVTAMAPMALGSPVDRDALDELARRRAG